MKVAALFLAVLATGCFDSLVDSPCAQGELVGHGECVVASDTPDAGGGHVDAPTPLEHDAFVCTADTVDDPLNCGACGVRCASGLCSASKCVGATRGQVVGIGHDYRHTNAVMNQVLANALVLGDGADLAVAHFTGTAAPATSAAIDRAVADALRPTGHPWHPVAMPPTAAGSFAGIDVIVVDPQGGAGDSAEAAGATWQRDFGTFVANGGVVVVLEAPDSVSYRFASGAGLYTLAAPSVVSGQAGYVVDGTDALAQSVLSPYLAEPDSVAFAAGSIPAVIATGDGMPIVFHLAY